MNYNDNYRRRNCLKVLVEKHSSLRYRFAPSLCHAIAWQRELRAELDGLRYAQENVCTYLQSLMGSRDDHACRLLYCGPLWKKDFTIQYDFVRLMKAKSVSFPLAIQCNTIFHLLQDQASSSRQVILLVGALQYAMLCTFFQVYLAFTHFCPSWNSQWDLSIKWTKAWPSRAYRYCRNRAELTGISDGVS